MAPSSAMGAVALEEPADDARQGPIANGSIQPIPNLHRASSGSTPIRARDNVVTLMGTPCIFPVP